MLHLKQGSPEWHKFRSNHIGSSDSPIIMNGVHFNKTVKQLYNEKISCTEISDNSNAAMRRGIELEPVARALFEAETGYLMSPDVKEHPTIKFMSASLDGIELDGKCILEIKCPRSEDHKIALDGAVPEKYIPQLQHQMEVYGMDWMYYMSYRSDSDYKIIEVKKDNDYTNKLILKEQEFWDRIQRKEPPENTTAKEPSQDWVYFINEWNQIQNDKQLNERREAEIKEEMLKLANYCPIEFSGFKIEKCIRKGNVEYSKIPELKGVDLNCFRKPSTEFWRFNFENQ